MNGTAMTYAAASASRGAIAGDAQVGPRLRSRRR